MSEQDPLAHWPERMTLTDDRGRTLLAYNASHSARSGRPWADGVWRPSSVPVEDAVKAMTHTLAGYNVSSSDPQLVTALESAGATPTRHAHVMSHRLGTVPATTVPAGLGIEPLSAQQLIRHAQSLAEIHVRAYPAGHPDHSSDDLVDAADELMSIARGEILGSYLSQSRVALAGRELVGACLLVAREGDPPMGGPWIVDIFRDPTIDLAGVGTALLVSVVNGAKSAGLPGVSLAVSHSNANALARYTAVGFDDVEESWTVAMP